MDTIGLWQVGDNGPVRLAVTELDAERDLEQWIEHDPALLERGLVIVGRQIRLEGGPLDLLALDPQGRWVLIEIKREQLRRNVIAQAIDYASCLQGAELDWLRERCDSYLQAKGSTQTLEGLLEQRGQSLASERGRREVIIYLVGTGLDSGLERMVGFLADRSDLAVRMVTFSTFRDAQGRFVLARAIHEGTEDARPANVAPSGAMPEAEAVLSQADQNGVGGVARTLYRAATEAGLHVRPWGRSIMFAPPSAKTRCLFTVWTDRRAQEPGVAKAYIAPEAFEQFYGIKETQLTEALDIGSINGWITLDQSRAERMAAGLARLLTQAA